jgi:hypothetical protein
MPKLDNYLSLQVIKVTIAASKYCKKPGRGFIA